MSGLFYLILVAAVAYFAKQKGRSPLGWALIALFISPLIASVILFFLKNLNTDRYDGDTIDTTARPVPGENPRPAPQRGNVPQAKSKVDIDESIRRMEDKLAKGKPQDVNATENAVATGTIGAAVLNDEKVEPAASETETIVEPDNVVKEEIVEPEVIELGPVAQETKQANVEDAQVVESPHVVPTEAPAQAVCESCGQPLVSGAKFCTNCGAPVSK